MADIFVEVLEEETLRNLSAENENFQQILKIEEEFFPWPWKLEDWLKFFSSSRNFSLSTVSCSETNKIIGFCLFEHFLLDQGSHLYKILITPQARGTGASHKLMTGHFEFLSSLGINNCFLEVATDNLGAIKFYEKFGMTKGVVKKKFYANGQDAVVMTGSI
jgi:ribosomal-protein-alanine N-acetyltransferase